MAHQIESNYAFFASNTPAWHKLGTVLKDAPSVDDAWRMAYPFEVFKLQAGAVITQDGKEIFEKSPDHSAIVRSDGKFLSFASNGYEVVQPYQVFDAYRPLIDEGLVELEAGGSLCEGKRIWALGKIKGAEAEILPGDKLKAYLLLHGSFDGSLPTGFKETGVRCVCANTIAMAMAGGMDMSSRHTKNTHKRLTDYRDQIATRLRNFHNNVEIMRSLATKQTPRKTQVQYVYDVLLTPAEQKQLKDDELSTRTANKVQYVVDLLDSQRGLQYVPAMRGTAWQAYNAVSEYITHESGRTDDSRVNSQWFGAGAALNQKAMQLAQAL